MEGQGRRVQVEIYVSPADQVVLNRYMGEINAIVEQDNELLKGLGQSPTCDQWTEQDTISALFASALDRERKLQTIKDGRGNEPPWITQLVRDALMELRAAS